MSTSEINFGIGVNGVISIARRDGAKYTVHLISRFFFFFFFLFRGTYGVKSGFRRHGIQDTVHVFFLFILLFTRRFSRSLFTHLWPLPFSIHFSWSYISATCSPRLLTPLLLNLFNLKIKPSPPIPKPSLQSVLKLFLLLSKAPFRSLRPPSSGTHTQTTMPT
jgi:hypothetical protein